MNIHQRTKTARQGAGRLLRKIHILRDDAPPGEMATKLRYAADLLATVEDHLLTVETLAEDSEQRRAAG